LHYAVNRSYSSEQGRFTQVDPIEMDAVNLEDPQTLNMYAYCGNDPINHVDPEGLFFGWLKKAFGAIRKFFSNIIVKIAVVVALTIISIGAASGAWSLFTVTTDPGLAFSIGGNALAGVATGAAAGTLPSLTALGWVTAGISAASGVGLPKWSAGIGNFRTPPINGGVGTGGVSNFLQEVQANMGGYFVNKVDTEILQHVFDIIRDRLNRPKCAKILGGKANAVRLLDRSRPIYSPTLSTTFRAPFAQYARRDALNPNGRYAAITPVRGRNVYIAGRFFNGSYNDMATVYFHELKHSNGKPGEPQGYDYKADFRQIRINCGLF